MTIILEQVGKAYPTFNNRLHALGTWLGLCQRKPRWVLRDISFRIEQGEAVGVIGVNGAGKSTLLKLITGTSMATTGRITAPEHIAALLELGMGFHPEFTGRQNVMLAGRMQGLERAEILELMPAIEAFADIGEYIDQPVRAYSSGMFVRLAFSVATAVRPQVLIIDEALAVGDAYFQHKSFARIREFREQGTTLLFVSHDPTTIKSLCDRAILLGEGKLLMDGRPDAVLDYYNALIARREEAELQPEEVTYAGRSGNGKACIQSLRLDSAGNPAQVLTVGAPLTLTLQVLANEYIDDLSLGFMIRDRTGYDVFGSNTWLRGELADLGHRPGESRQVVIRLPSLRLGPGSYSLALALHSGASHVAGNYDWWDKAAVFQIVADNNQPHFAGLCALQASIELAESPQHTVE
ncbi:ABC transporter ATP-binding protein [Stutzerimonas nitrititolerans]|uniref:ABC transporter ATP-binding protein n=1 Tax=Stutzerimonas nitrititolerans TaxID=2482751 RepID=UPI0028AE1807|nr:ABC transporter ATP-binding protein [Stutzerimonas nitrititolerans]